MIRADLEGLFSTKLPHLNFDRFRGLLPTVTLLCVCTAVREGSMTTVSWPASKMHSVIIFSLLTVYYTEEMVISMKSMTIMHSYRFG